MTAALLPLSLVLTGMVCAPARPGDAAVTSARAVTTPGWARLVDRVPTPVLHWTTCQKTEQCATAELPLDYRDPHGAKIKVALLRVNALDPRHRLGSIFVNPGGPGASARAWAARLPQVLPKAILDRFDIVGVDPRGVGGSTPLRCFATKAEQIRTLAPFSATPFPETQAEQRAWTGAARALGRACSSTGRPVASAMDTTDDALDMDVLRRAVGDRKLTYFGQSYGSYLGLVYANMFPGRVRAIAIDGIVDPQELVGMPATADVPVFDRMGSAAASYRALHELLDLCQRAGRPRCSFADADTPARFARLAARLQGRPLRLGAPGIKATTFRYANLIADTEDWLHDPSGYRGLFRELTDLARLTAASGAGPSRAALVRSLLRLRAALQAPPGYDNLLEAESGIVCTDSLNAPDADSWPAAAAAADRRARYFGAYYAWLSVQCARNTWTAQDQDAYRGRFDRRTSAPVLVIGNWWDPATSYASAVKVARLLPSSRLVSSDSWGHTALLTSACVDNTVWGYLLHPLAPAPKITRCRGDVRPFAGVVYASGKAPAKSADPAAWNPKHSGRRPGASPGNTHSGPSTSLGAAMAAGRSTAAERNSFGWGEQAQPAKSQRAAGPGDPLVRGLGWASAGLGIPMLAAPGWLSRAIGVGELPRHRVTTAVVGVRELAAAAGLLSRGTPGWLWMRAVGDMMDLGLLASAVTGRTKNKRRLLIATAAVIGITGIDVYGAVSRSRRRTEMELTAAVTIASSRQDAYSRWRQLENLPEFMAHLDDVRETGRGVTHWRATAPFGKTVEWDAEITADVPGERIGWRSVNGAAVDNQGEVRFVPAPGGRGSEVHVTMRYRVPGGKLGVAAARYFGEDPHQQLDDDLRRFKQVVETGETVRSDGAPGGKRARREFPQHPARPLSADELEEMQS